VIDKDLAGALLAHEIGAESFIILTSVEKVFLNYGKANQEPISKLSLKEAKEHYEQGQFPAEAWDPRSWQLWTSFSVAARKLLLLP